MRRPEGLPADAIWSEGEGEWTRGPLRGGQRHGVWTFWRPDGTRVAESTYVDGVAEGPYARFHQNGEISQEGALVGGARHGPCWWRRSTGETTEHTFPDGAPDVLWASCSVLERGVTLSTRVFDRGGQERALNGDPLPPRPAGVPETAAFDGARWRDGAQAGGKALGLWRWWTADGAPAADALHDDAGERIAQGHYSAPGGEVRSYRRKDMAGDLLREVRYRDGAVVEETTIERAGGAATRWTTTEEGAVTFEGTPSRCVWLADGAPEIEVELDAGLIAAITLAGARIDLRAVGRRGAVDPDLKWGALAAATTLCGDIESDALEGVDAVPWGEIEGCMAYDVDAFPLYLRACLSPHAAVRAYALGQIEGEIEHQGSISEATAAALPWLGRLLSDPRADRIALLRTIQMVAALSHPYRARAEADRGEDWARDILGTLEAAQALWADLPDTDDEAELALILALAGVTTGRDDWLRAAAGGAKTPRLRACAVEALADRRAPLTHLAGPLADPSLLVRGVAAIAAGRVHGPACGGAVVAALGEVVTDWASIARDYHALPWVDAHVLSMAAFSAGCVGVGARALAPALTQRLPRVGPLDVSLYARGLLALCLGRGEPPFAPDTPEVLAALRATDALFEWVNGLEVLRRWRLPQDPAALDALLAEIDGPGWAEALRARLVGRAT